MNGKNPKKEKRGDGLEEVGMFGPVTSCPVAPRQTTVCQYLATSRFRRSDPRGTKTLFACAISSAFSHTASSLASLDISLLLSCHLS